MLDLLRTLFHTVRAVFMTADDRILEVAALRHQLGVANRTVRRHDLRMADRLFFVLLSRVFARWKEALVIVQPATVIAWHRALFRRHWARVSRVGRGRPKLRADLIALIRRLSVENPTWGSPRIEGELDKLGAHVAKSTIERYMVKRPRYPGSGTWMTFLRNHAKQIASVDFLTMPTIGLRVLYVMLVLSHDRRRVLHFAVTEHPTAAWAARQITRAIAGVRGLKYLLRENDKIYGGAFDYAVGALGLETLHTTHRSPWQNPFVERLNGSVRRECLDHVIVVNERHLEEILANYFDYYHAARTHLGLKKDAPIPRAIEGPELGEVVSMPFVGGLHHRYSRRAAQPIEN